MERTASRSVLARVTAVFSELTLEQKAAVGLAAVTLVQGFRCAPHVSKLRAKEAKDQGQKIQRLPSTGRIQDHPVFSWLLGNGSVIACVALKQTVLGKLEKTDSILRLFGKLMVGSMLSVDVAMLLNYFYIKHLYKHIPFFSEKHNEQTYWEIFNDYMCCNFVVNVFAGAVQIGVFRTLTAQLTPEAEKSMNGPFRPLRFLARLALTRFIVDAFFWLGHYSLHMKRCYWAHHEHKFTQLTTNYHFAWYDLLIEAFVPFFVASIIVERVNPFVGELDLNLLAQYMFTHEIASHAGKPVPYMNCIQPLAPFFQATDDRNIFSHELHHRNIKHNLSISYYFDVLVGTSKWDISKSPNPVSEPDREK